MLRLLGLLNISTNLFVDQVSRLERKLAEVEEQLHIEMTAKDEIEHEQK